MKRQLHTILAATAVSAFACSALAQDTTNPQKDQRDYSRHESAQERRADRLNGAAKASELIGMEVKNYQDEKLGNVEDLGVDMESGRVVQVILSYGGFIGIGKSLTAVPPGALHHDTAAEVLHLNADKAKLESAPKFDADKWGESSSSNRLAAIYSLYGEEPAFNFIGQGETRRDGQRNQTDQRQTDQRQTDRAAVPRNVVTRNNDQAWDQSRSARARQDMIPAERLGKLERASKLIGMTVKNRQDETLGDVDNILVDLTSGRVVAVVLSSGGFLGMGDELSAVPPTALQFSADRDSLQLDTTKEQLSSAPHFKANQWPDFAQPEQAGGIYRAYQVEPYFSTDATTDADNTRRNVRDRNDQTLTPLDQGNSPADIRTTASIRKEIVAADNMSVNAKNVKIITKDGRVTLRGAVNSAEEKRLIGEIANGIARAANVDNQLEVKRTTSGD
ncbi:MAG TPA: PRC-barrel domain-containing protein [Methylomirabilota bacterium]|nr:PRC-barrel domain-containing protein [Methylomirabilota bacterium]